MEVVRLVILLCLADAGGGAPSAVSRSRISLSHVSSQPRSSILLAARGGFAAASDAYPSATISMHDTPREAENPAASPVSSAVPAELVAFAAKMRADGQSEAAVAAFGEQ
ncbi:hypothetical protein T492DRAFT_855998, partial [Pavlovales sp. CCMP2436]